jgi:glycosyltransferase involved in cell wall biosynthesis
MKVVLVNATMRRGGAALAMGRVGEALRARGVEMHVVALDNLTATDWPPQGAPRSLLFETLAERLPLLKYPRQWPKLRTLSFSPSIRIADASDRINALAADVVNLHWVNYGHVSPEGLGRIGAPVVWTAHDMWPITGGCHHSGPCERFTGLCGCCPVLGSKAPDDLSSRLMRRKQRSWEGRNIRLVCPSNWLANQARRSTLFARRPVAVIPNPLDLRRFSPSDKAAARQRLGLPRDGRLVMFGSTKGVRIKEKGYAFLDQALQRIVRGLSEAAKPHLMIAGSDRSDAGSIKAQVPVHWLGQMKSEAMADAYRAADVFALPSMYENLPNMIAEALACGTPAVAFDVGGIGDLITHRINGYLAKPFEVDDLAAGLQFCLDADGSLADAARRHVETLLDPDAIAARYIDEFNAAIRSGH